jgi:hypothetical protein
MDESIGRGNMEIRNIDWLGVIGMLIIFLVGLVLIIGLHQ